MTGASLPAGWYPDPSTRHERRYWDGTRWSASVLDGLQAAQDPPINMPLSPTISPGGPPPVPSGYGAAAAGYGVATAGFRVTQLATWRWLLVVFGFGLLLLAFLLEAGSFLVIPGMSRYGVDEEWIFIWAWLYQPPAYQPGGFVTQGLLISYPPILLFPGLLLAMLALGSVSGNLNYVLTKAGAKVARLWSSPDDQARSSAARLRIAATAGTRYYRDYSPLKLLLAGIGSVAMIAISGLAIVNHQAATVDGIVTSDLFVGLGPQVCLAAGIIGLIVSVLCWPFGAQQVLIHPDGSADRPVGA